MWGWGCIFTRVHMSIEALPSFLFPQKKKSTDQKQSMCHTQKPQKHS